MLTLNPGARIDVVAPAGAVDAERLDKGLATLRGWGYQPAEAPGLRARHRNYAGPRARRSAELNAALTGAAELIAFARGGAGTMELLAALPPVFEAPPVLGYSDASALHAALERRGLVGIHGPIVQELGDDSIDEASRGRLRAALAGEDLPPIPCQRIAGPGRAVEGRLIGGNLQVLASLCGSPWTLDGAGGILVLEDVNEAPYRVDRCLEQLALSGVFEGLRGLVLGDFSGSGGLINDEVSERVAERFAAAAPFPVYAGAPVGHAGRNWCWFYGARARLDGEGITQPGPDGASARSAR